MNAPQTAPAADAPDRSRGTPFLKLGLPLVALGALLTVLALLSEAGRSRIGYGYLLGFTFLWTVVVGSLFFVALQHVTGSVWSVTMRRVAEMLSAPVGLLLVLFVPVVVFGLLQGFGLFSWMHADPHHADHLLETKAAYLNVPFWLVRAGVFFLVWLVFSLLFVRGSLRQDDGRAGAETTARMRRWSGPFLVLFAFTVTFAAFDWLMSLDPHWFSTIYGVYVFSGMTLAGLASIALVVLFLRARGWIDPALVTREHLYSLGGLLFAFTCFWAYIAFSQFMLIWYANLPEETVWFVHRSEHGWLAVSWVLALLRFAVPFFLLLGRDSKSDPRRLVLASVLILLGQLLDLYWLIMPEAPGGAPQLGLAEIGPTLLLTGLLLAFVARFLSRHAPVPVGDPLLERSRHFHLP